ncbi:zinc metalloproteinase nas-6-like [Tubulanus polymorphus]|uniref:zinc metalloproteinase nas-6-like n=1 Tax=Tubulanus polymorphus TaxID=672921 RepID=UPI003DA22DDA
MKTELFYQGGNEQAKIEHAVQMLNYLVNKGRSYRSDCIRFKPRTSQTDYVKIQKGKECSSSIGKIGAVQSVSLNSECLDKNGVIRELIHVLGFGYEQNRPDRDQFVAVNWDNVKPEYKDSFKIEEKSVTLGVPYNYRSVMHLNRYQFSKNGKPTLTPKRTGELMGGGVLQPLDVKKIRILYKCTPYEPETDIFGMRKSEYKQQAGPDIKGIRAYDGGSCKEACMRNHPACVASTFNVKTKSCYLHSALRKLKSSSDCIYFKKFDHSKCQMTELRSTGVAGTVLYTLTLESAGMCRDSCRVDEECLEATYRTDSRKCFFMAKSIARFIDQKRIHFIKQC